MRDTHSVKRMTNRRDLTAPVSGRGESENDAYLATIMGQKEGRPDGWRVGRDFPMVARESRASRWGLTVPDFRALIAAKNASFLAVLGDPLSGWKWVRK